MSFLSIFLNSDLCVLREARWQAFFSVPARSHAFILRLVCIIFVFYARRTGTLLFPGRSHALYYTIRRTRSTSRLFLICFFYFIYNAPRKTKPKDVLQFIFLRSPRKPKSKDFLQLILLIFYFEYPSKTWRNPFLVTNFLLCTSSSRSYFTSWRPTNCLSVHLSNHQNLFFQVKITLFYQTFFQRNVISQLLSQTRCITSLYYHKKHLINNFGFLICRRGFTCWWLFRWGWSFILSPTWFIYISSPSPPPSKKKTQIWFFNHNYSSLLIFFSNTSKHPLVQCMFH